MLNTRGALVIRCKQQSTQHQINVSPDRQVFHHYILGSKKMKEKNKNQFNQVTVTFL